MDDQDNGTYAQDRADAQFLGKPNTEMGSSVALAALPLPGTMSGPLAAAATPQATLRAALDDLGSFIQDEAAKAVVDLEEFAEVFVGGAATGSGTSGANATGQVNTVDAFVATVATVKALFSRAASATARIKAGHG